MRYRLVTLRVCFCILVFCAFYLAGQSAFAQATGAPAAIAQAAPPPVGNPTPNILPTDVTPTGINQEREIISPGFTFRLFQRLPERLWFNTTTEVSNRYESNVFFTQHQQRSDYVFRVLPNITVGYNILKHTSVYTNWFLIKDEFAVHGNKLNFPTTQSLSMGLRQDLYTGRRLNLQGDFQARELWQTAHLHQFDFIPQLILTYTPQPKPIVLFANLQLQLRGKNYFIAPNREIDPFYTVGALYQWHKFTFSATNTFVTNFRHPPFKNPVPLHGNVSDIADFEVAHPVTKKIPSLVAFMRAEPIWNWKSGLTPGISGFDFRLYGGLRLAFGKPSFMANIERLREQLLEQENEPPNKSEPSNPAPSVSPSTPAPASSEAPHPENIGTTGTTNTISATVFRPAAPSATSASLPARPARQNVRRHPQSIASAATPPRPSVQTAKTAVGSGKAKPAVAVASPSKAAPATAAQDKSVTPASMKIFDSRSFISDDELPYQGQTTSTAVIDPGVRLFIQEPQPAPVQATPAAPVQYIGSAFES